MLPSLFVSHGAPTFALRPGRIGRRLQQLGRRLARPSGIVMVSAHWQTAGVRVTGSAWPPTIHDFGGFPQALYALHYPAPGDPALAGRVVELLNAVGWPAAIDPARGLDHGAWVPLRHLYPAADIPVVQVSLPRDLDGPGAWRLGRALAPLRELDALIVGSGSLTHNLTDFFSGGRTGRAEAALFRDRVRHAIRHGDAAALCHALESAPGARRAHPTAEHYLPLPLAAAAGGLEASLRLSGGWMGGVISVDAFVFGIASPAGNANLSAA